MWMVVKEMADILCLLQTCCYVSSKWRNQLWQFGRRMCWEFEGVTVQLFHFSIGLLCAFGLRSLWCPKTFAAVLGKVYLLYRSTLHISDAAVEYLSAMLLSGYAVTSELAGMFHLFLLLPKRLVLV